MLQSHPLTIDAVALIHDGCQQIASAQVLLLGLLNSTSARLDYAVLLVVLCVDLQYERVRGLFIPDSIRTRTY